MKHLKTFLLFFVVLVLSNDAIGQQPYLLTDDSNKWYEYGAFGGFGPYSVQHVHLQYSFNGDTTIGGLTYKKLFQDRKDTTYSTPMYLQNTYGYIAAFRQDLLKVYFIMKDSTTERLYCDFDLAVGDTLKYLYSPHEIIDSIASIPFGNTTRTRYILHNGFSFYEGVGNALGLFHDYSIGIEGGVYLVCFEQAGITQHVHDFWWPSPACNISSTTGVASNNTAEVSLSVFPNPFSNQIIFRLTDNEPRAISLYNFLGQQVLYQTFVSATTINTEHLPKGIYIYKLRDDKGTINTGKVIKE